MRFTISLAPLPLSNMTVATAVVNGAPIRTHDKSEIVAVSRLIYLVKSAVGLPRNSNDIAFDIAPKGA
jgi:hypothetical protein